MTLSPVRVTEWVTVDETGTLLCNAHGMSLVDHACEYTAAAMNKMEPWTEMVMEHLRLEEEGFAYEFRIPLFTSVFDRLFYLPVYMKRTLVPAYGGTVTVGSSEKISVVGRVHLTALNDAEEAGTPFWSVPIEHRNYISLDSIYPASGIGPVKRAAAAMYSVLSQYVTTCGNLFDCEMAGDAVTAAMPLTALDKISICVFGLCQRCHLQGDSLGDMASHDFSDDIPAL